MSGDQELMQMQSPILSGGFYLRVCVRLIRCQAVSGVSDCQLTNNKAQTFYSVTYLELYVAQIRPLSPWHVAGTQVFKPGC